MLLQVSAYAYTLGMVTMQLKLPHSSVLTGVWCRVWQVRSGSSAGGAVGQAPEGSFRSRSWPATSPSCHRSRCHTLRKQRWAPPLRSLCILQACVVCLGGCMIVALRGRINGRPVLSSAAGAAVAASFQGPKHL